MKLSELLKRMFVERCCVVCGEAISYDCGEPFCEECVEHWREFLKVKCRKCGREHNLCTCLPQKIKKVNHSLAPWCVFYDASTNGEINKLFYNMKRRYHSELIDMCAERMKTSLLIAARTRQINLNDYVVTFAPRRDAGVIKYGFDQSEKLSKSLAKKLGLVHVTTLENLGKREQKGLNKTERMQNAVSNYEYVEGSLKDYKNVIVVDDIMTSGATLYACAFLLFKNGATNVIPVAFAKDNYNAKGDKRNVKRNSKYNFTGAFKGFM